MSYSQLFKRFIPNNKLFELFDKICAKTDTFYILDNNAYKKGVFTGIIQEFFEFCKPFYYISKRIYLERELTNKTFLTVIRQICKHNKIHYKTNIIYNKSVYDTVYHIHFI